MSTAAFIVMWSLSMILGGVISQTAYLQGRRHGIEAERRRAKWVEIDKAVDEERYADALRLTTELRATSSGTLWSARGAVGSTSARRSTTG